MPEGATLRRLIERDDITCPAGDTREGGRGVQCRVVDVPLMATEQPDSISAYCMGCYTECPVWRDDKERGWRGEQSAVEEDAAPPIVAPEPLERRWYGAS